MPREKDAQPTRRLSPRYDCRISARVVSLPARDVLNGEIVNVSFGGALLEVGGLLGPEVVVEFESQSGKIILGAYVIREGESGPRRQGSKFIYGIEFHTYGGMEDRFWEFLGRLAGNPASPGPTQDPHGQS